MSLDCARQQVEALVKRRAAANQLGKLKPFDTALQLAKDLMNGEAVSPSKFRNAASTFKGDKQLSEIFTALSDLAKAPAKDSRASKTSLIDTYKQRIESADSAEALSTLAKEIQRDTNLTDKQAQDLDDAVFDAQDKFEQEDEDTGRSDTLNRDSSWIIRDKRTGAVALETTQKSVVDKVNTEKYEAVPALQHLQELNTEGSKAYNAARGKFDTPDGDLLGDNTAKAQAVADAEKAKDDKRNAGKSDSTDFKLTGSDSEADQAAANGAQSLFSNRKQTDSPAFKSWFKNSKVVDASGNPLAVYHGSKNKFEVFDYTKIGANGRAEGQGFYFTSNEDVAKGYGKPLELYLSIQKPMPYDQKPFTKSQMVRILKNIAEAD